MKVCITGGTGTLGSALVRKLSGDGHGRVVVLSRDEQKQALLADSLTYTDNVRFFLGDVRDQDRLVDAFHGCDTVIHAAALKRVDAVAYNPTEVRKTNIQGSANVTAAALAAGVKRVLMISSDKACEPTNIYGVTKAAMEHEAVAFNTISVPRGMRVACTRYGNVLGSRGSVIHIWREKAAKGEALPLTSTQMTRFWLTVDNAVCIVLEALQSMHGGEIFVPRLPAMALTDLAHAIAPRADFKITGLRPGGEKLHETLVTAEESSRIVPVNSYLMAIAPHMSPWRRDGWATTMLGGPLTSDTADRLTIDDMKKILEVV
jgi:UDP-N-acetylglucosamine 4,6-dehydratase/5-epimerase